MYYSNTNLFFLLTWACSCIAFQYFGWKIFRSCLNFRGQSWKCAYFGAKLAFITRIFLKNYPWYMKVHFQFYVFAIWSIPASILPIIAWKAPANSWSPSELAMFLILIPSVLGRSVNFKIPKRFLFRLPVFPDNSIFLITIACDSLTLIFFSIIPAIMDTANYFASWQGFQRWRAKGFAEETERR